SACFRIAMIWLSENLDCFIAELSSSKVENSTSDPVYLLGVLPTDHIPDINYVRQRLAVTPEFKPEVGSVQKFLIPEGVQLQKGVVGPQVFEGVAFPGGGSQVQILNFTDRAKLIPVGEPRPIQ
ncbi:hypothetical protein NQT62_14330, partial [Limnobacter humi]